MNGVRIQSYSAQSLSALQHLDWLALADHAINTVQRLA